MEAAAVPNPSPPLRQVLESFHRPGIADRIKHTRPHKMTEKLADPIGVRLEMTKREKLERIAASQGLNAVDVMRHLADKYIEEYEAQFRALKSIFGDLGD